MGVIGRCISALLPDFKTEAVSLTGLRHENQDNYLIIAQGSDGQPKARWLRDASAAEETRASWPSRWIRLAVLDGMGGHTHGREIAEAAVDALRRLPPCQSTFKQRRAVVDLHRNLLRQFGTGQANSPGTTLVWAEIDRLRRRCHLLHLGDSRAWLGMNDRWHPLTHDHTLAEFGYRDGRIDPSAYAAESERRNQPLAQALGHGTWGVIMDAEGHESFGFAPEIRLDAMHDLSPSLQGHADLRTIDLPRGTPLILATDGLWSGIGCDLPPPTELMVPGAIGDLAQTAIDAGSTDNTTLIIGHFDPEPAS
ncbi:protein serine/threonine phosphatase [Thiorhodococcus drewsii AZ1]|uniref:Protein serine/threonine phosphatase n=1 Tax=Thiorhodococcus drewsii AZ1 TaxID=765913 RepID=G2DWQ1_9GAMM|nr:PP2C family protein-serine/threonine phosphatase [Thiorhodococcus drewsii]EGV33751.1 protein serine/threonine phosphatase [Thiorhodococcus drewsii AZ1]